MPEEVPGAAVSPGSRICSLVTAPELTVIGGLVYAVLVASVTSMAVTVQLPAVLFVSAKDFVPETKAALTGNTSLASLELMLITSAALLTKFQYASTAFTVTL